MTDGQTKTRIEGAHISENGTQTEPFTADGVTLTLTPVAGGPRHSIDLTKPDGSAVLLPPDTQLVHSSKSNARMAARRVAEKIGLTPIPAKPMPPRKGKSKGGRPKGSGKKAASKTEPVKAAPSAAKSKTKTTTKRKTTRGSASSTSSNGHSSTSEPTPLATLSFGSSRRDRTTAALAVLMGDRPLDPRVMPTVLDWYEATRVLLDAALGTEDT